MWNEIALIIVLGLISLFLFGQLKQSGKKGNILERVIRKYPRYHNRDKHTMGRLAGSKAIEKINEQYRRIRYKKGLFHYEVDEDIPVWAIREYSGAECGMPEGLVEVEPHKESTRWATNKEKIIMEMHHLTGLNKMYAGLVERLSAQLVEGVNLTVVQDQMKNIAELVKETEKRVKGIKETAEETPLVRMEEKKPTIKPTATS